MLQFSSILVAALATMPVGYLWYSPFLFAKPWMHLNKIHHTQMKKGPGVFPLLVSLFSGIVIAFLISVLMNIAGIHTLGRAWKLGLLLWFGFDFLPGFMRYLFDKRPLELLLINSGHAAANIIVICWVLMLMR
ncbi:MAG: DUF1761 domain-containing protein [Candidatus Peribacteraceae bacterium]|nr:DUF1761 domain-containing protein [Candidatus Peribacteraceae bacterium]